ncbi:MAG: glycosyltransferase family 2 protein [Candidatus Woesearchaeota archaeon]
MPDLSFYIIWSAYFVSLYFVIFWILVLLEKGYKDSVLKPLKSFPKVSVIIPAYNEGEKVAGTIESALRLNYPKEKLEIIAVNHGSSDNTLEVMNRYREGVKVVTYGRKGQERKGGAVNFGLKIATGEFVACLDADSSIEPDALHKMLPYFEDKELGAVLPKIIPSEPKNFIQKIQYCEYVVVFFFKKMMGAVDCLYTAPGPFSLYRRSVIEKVGGFDAENLTEDMELAVRLQKNHYKIIQTTDVEANTITPHTFKDYFNQRNRWYKGALFNIFKHRDLILNRKYGDFGMLQMPFIPGAAILSVLVFTIITINKLLVPAFKKLQAYYYGGINFGLFFEWLRNFSILDLNFDMLFWFWLLIVIQLVLIVWAHKVTKKKLFKERKSSPIAFLFIYSITIFIVWWYVIFDLLKMKTQRW